jgi:hypothetical protein
MTAMVRPGITSSFSRAAAAEPAPPRTPSAGLARMDTRVLGSPHSVVRGQANWTERMPRFPYSNPDTGNDTTGGAAPAQAAPTATASGAK